MNRYLFTVLAAALMAAPAVHAQSTEAMHQQHGDSAKHARMMTKLGLTPDQKARIDAIHRKYAAQMKAGHDSEGMEKMGKMSPAQDSTMKRAMAEIRAELNSSQQVLFDSMMTEHMKHREAREHADREGPGHEHKQAPRSSPPR